MWFRSWFDSIIASSNRPTKSRARRRSDRREARQLFLEGLEDRSLMAFNVLAVYATGAAPVDLALSQIDAGSQLDLVVANNTGLSVLFGDGKGNFSLPESYPIEGVSSIATGDFNSDGKIDLALTVARNLVVVLNVGNGKFGKPSSFPVGGEAVAVASGDFNGDGKLDLATLNPKQLNISIVIGDGKGSFGKAVDVAAETSARAIIAADFNGDGKSDIATADDRNNSISIFLADAHGAFPTHQNFAVGARPFWLAAGAVVGEVEGRDDGRLVLASLDFRQRQVRHDVH